MAFDLPSLQRAVAEHGQVARIVIAAIAGSSPREVGASMLVWDGGQSGTIGGGALEYQAANSALTKTGLSRHPLGPELGQCCGGAVTLLTEQYDAQSVAALDGLDVVARGAGDMPLAVRRCLDQARAQGQTPPAHLLQNWMIEPVLRPDMPVWIWGAGHVGRALVDVLSPMPWIDLTWIDTAPNRFPDNPNPAATCVPATEPTQLVPHAPETAMHLVLTYSHELDLRLCHALLNHRFSFAGLIGSDTKWARFRKRLSALGHQPTDIDRITCPIGQKTLGKHPSAIAVGVAGQLLEIHNNRDSAKWPIRSLQSKA